MHVFVDESMSLGRLGLQEPTSPRMWPSTETLTAQPCSAPLCALKLPSVAAAFRSTLHLLCQQLETQVSMSLLLICKPEFVKALSSPRWDMLLPYTSTVLPAEILLVLTASGLLIKGTLCRKPSGEHYTPQPSPDPPVHKTYSGRETLGLGLLCKTPKPKPQALKP